MFSQVHPFKKKKKKYKTVRNHVSVKGLAKVKLYKQINPKIQVKVTSLVWLFNVMYCHSVSYTVYTSIALACDINLRT